MLSTSRQELSQVLRKQIWEELHRHLLGIEWTRPLCVLLSVQCPLQTIPITQSPARYIYTHRCTHGDGIYCAKFSRRLA